MSLLLIDTRMWYKTRRCQKGSDFLTTHIDRKYYQGAVNAV